MFDASLQPVRMCGWTHSGCRVALPNLALQPVRMCGWTRHNSSPKGDDTGRLIYSLKLDPDLLLRIAYRWINFATVPKRPYEQFLKDVKEGEA